MSCWIKLWYHNASSQLKSSLPPRKDYRPVALNAFDPYPDAVWLSFTEEVIASALHLTLNQLERRNMNNHHPTTPGKRTLPQYPLVELAAGLSHQQITNCAVGIITFSPRSSPWALDSRRALCRAHCSSPWWTMTSAQCSSPTTL